MKTNARSHLRYLSFSVAVGLTLGYGIIAVKAWAPPPVAPPNGNLGAPINISGVGQAKTGPLQVNGFRNLGATILDGNVGIGTTTPTQKLDVNGNINVRGSQVRMSNSNTYFYGDASNAAVRTPGSFYIQSADGSAKRNLVAGAAYLSGGAFAMGTNTGQVRLVPGDSANTGYVGWHKPNGVRVGYMGWSSLGAGNLGIGLENSANLIINGGNVGVGVTAPAQKLDINGGMRLRGTANCSGKLYTNASGDVLCGTDNTGGGSHSHSVALVNCSSVSASGGNWAGCSGGKVVASGHVNVSGSGTTEFLCCNIQVNNN